MREAAEHGCIDRYRVIDGNQWLTLCSAAFVEPGEDTFLAGAN
jgi:hypothetical protein